MNFAKFLRNPPVAASEFSLVINQNKRKKIIVKIKVIIVIKTIPQEMYKKNVV